MGSATVLDLEIVLKSAKRTLIAMVWADILRARNLALAFSVRRSNSRKISS